MERDNISDILPLSNFLHPYGVGPPVKILFDGHPTGPTIKNHELSRRSAKITKIAPTDRLRRAVSQVDLKCIL